MFGSSLSDEVESRTVYGDRDENGVAVHWVDGDEIAIFCKETSQPANHLVNYKIKPNAGDPSKASEVMKVDPNAAGLQWGKDELHHFMLFIQQVLCMELNQMTSKVRLLPASQ